MLSLTSFVAIVILMSVLVRSAWIIARGAGILTAGWESAGWLTLALFIGMAYASTDTEAEDQKSFEVTQPVEVATSDRREAVVPDKSVRPPKLLTPQVNDKAVGNNLRVQVNPPAAAEGTGPEDRSQEGMSRRDMLAELHADTIEKFVKSPGFGFERRIRIRIDEFDTPEKNRMYLPRNPLLAGSAGTREIPLPDRSHWKAGTPAESNNLRGLQQIAQRLRTANASRRKTEETTAQPEPKEIRVVESRPEWDEWEVTDWELVSLLKNDPPVAYSSRNLQMMHRPGQTATRALDKLESGALAQLRKGETLVVAHGINAIRMVGAVHAAANCLQCHKGKKVGDLLGAFSYELHRTQPIALAAKIGN